MTQSFEHYLRDPRSGDLNALLSLGGSIPPVITAHLYASGRDLPPRNNSTGPTNNTQAVIANISAPALDINEQASATSYTTTQSTTTPITVTYTYDALGRLEQVSSTNGDVQYYGLDAEDNRNLTTETLGSF